MKCLQAERATRQRRPLLQLKTRGLMLPARCWKRLLQLYQCKVHANGSTLSTTNKAPICWSLIVYKWRGRWGNVALFRSWKRSNWGFQLIVGSIYCNSVYGEGMRWEHFTQGKQNAYLPIFKFLQVERATRQRRPLLQLKTKQLMLPARRWKRSLQLGICRWDAMEALHRRQQNTCLLILKCLQAERTMR